MHNAVLIIMYVFAWKKNVRILWTPTSMPKENVFSIGDCARIEIDGKLATKKSQEAERQAKYLAHHFRNRIMGTTIEKYSVRASTDSQAALISLGADCAVGVVGKTCIGSYAADLLADR